MKTAIFYFSGTGNCLKIARDLAGELGDSQIVAIAEAVKGDLNISSERIGIVFPVYAVGMPLIVSDFINKLNIPNDRYIFAIATCAQVAADTLGQTRRLLERKGLKLSTGFIIKMPNNYTPFGGAIASEKQETLFAKELERVRDIARLVRDNIEQKIETAKFPLRLAGAIISPYAKLVMRGEDKNFWATSECNGCGICEKVCPVNNIKLVDKRPVWLHRCEQCFACFQWCPEETIQCGRSTLGRKRYHNPYVTLKDFIRKTD